MLRRSSTTCDWPIKSAFHATEQAPAIRHCVYPASPLFSWYFVKARRFRPNAVQRPDSETPFRLFYRSPQKAGRLTRPHLRSLFWQCALRRSNGSSTHSKSFGPCKMDAFGYPGTAAFTRPLPDKRPRSCQFFRRSTTISRDVQTGSDATTARTGTTKISGEWWSGRRESNPRLLRGRQRSYHYTTPALHYAFR